MAVSVALSPRPRPRKGIGAATAAILGLTAAVVPASSAAAEPHVVRGSSQVAYTDARTPNTSVFYPGYSSPVGTWRDADNRWHISRTYVTFDISGLQASRFGTAVATAQERTVNNCAKPLSLRMRPTELFTPQHSWRNPPRPGTPVTSAVNVWGGCPAGRLDFDVTAAVLAAVGRGETALTFEISLPGIKELLPAYWRALHVNEFRLEVTYRNTPPPAPTDLKMWNLDIPCTGDQHFQGVDVSAIALISDPDGDALRPEMEYWSLDHPEARTTVDAGIISGSQQWGIATIPAGSLADGVYAWRMRVNDTREWSAWSAECRFTVDKVAPGPPTVTSTDYPAVPAPPSGGPFLPGLFTFGGNGDPDIAGFRYGDSIFTLFDRVDADQPGGSATVEWFPMFGGEQELYVVSVDRAGNQSEPTVYRFAVAEG